MTVEQLAAYIDHTLLKPEATRAQVRTLCDEAMQYEFKAVCVNSVFVKDCASLLKGTNVAVCTVVGFPLGAMSTEAKREECRIACGEGAREIDMVLWIGGLLSGADDLVAQDIGELGYLCRERGAELKVIFETAMLSEAQIARACELSITAGAHWVKTSTGFGPGGATVDAVRIMHREVSAHGLKVKASGGIRTLKDVRAMVDAGAERIGTSSGVAIVKESIAEQA
ncbi:MAG: deoxyribose-phosphate aldolase [bacterium]|nr:deoxyribose-phosphate aldolase [bacterium]